MVPSTSPPLPAERWRRPIVASRRKRQPDALGPRYPRYDEDEDEDGEAIAPLSDGDDEGV